MSDLGESSNVIDFDRFKRRIEKDNGIAEDGFFNLSLIHREINPDPELSPREWLKQEYTGRFSRIVMLQLKTPQLVRENETTGDVFAHPQFANWYLCWISPAMQFRVFEACNLCGAYKS